MCVPRRLLLAVMLTAVAVVAHLFMHVDVTADAVAERDRVLDHGHAFHAAVLEPAATTPGGQDGSDSSHDLMTVLCMAVLATLWMAAPLMTPGRVLTGLEPHLRRWGDAPLRSSPLRRRGDRIDAGIVLLV